MSSTTRSRRPFFIALCAAAAALVLLLTWSLTTRSPTEAPLARPLSPPGVEDEIRSTATVEEEGSRAATTPLLVEDPARRPLAVSVDWLDPSNHLAVTIEARVVDAAGSSVEGAAVRLVEHIWDVAVRARVRRARAPHSAAPAGEPDLLGSTTTDRGGRFHIDASVLAPRPGHTDVVAAAVHLVVFTKGMGCTMLPLPRSARVSIDVGTVELGPESLCTGRIVDEIGQPLAGIPIRPRLVRFGEVVPRMTSVDSRRDLIARLLTTASAADGSFLLHGMSPGHWRLELGRPGAAGERPFSFKVDKAGTSLELGDLVLPLGRFIAGVVIDQEGQPVAGALVRLSGSADESSVLETIPSRFRALSIRRDTPWVRTDVNGTFRLAGLDHAVYSVFAGAPGHATVRLDWVATGRTELLLRLERRPAVALQVVDARTGAPLTQACVRVDPVPYTHQRLYRDDSIPSFDLVAADPRIEPAPRPGPGQELPVGRFLLTGVDPEDVAVIAEADGYATLRAALYELPVAPSGTYLLSLSLACTIHGRLVTGPTDQPVGPARVYLVEASTRNSVLTSTDWCFSDAGPDGCFRFDGLAPGRYGLTARAQGFLEQFPLRHVADLGEPGTRAQIDVRLHRTGTVKGVVLGPTGLPVAGTRVTVAHALRGATALKRSTHTDGKRPTPAIAGSGPCAAA